MTLIKSISGIRGTVGGYPGDNLTPLDIVKFVSAYATWLKTGAGKKKAKIVLGRDARVSGDMYAKLVAATLTGFGTRCGQYRFSHDADNRDCCDCRESGWRYHSDSQS